MKTNSRSGLRDRRLRAMVVLDSKAREVVRMLRSRLPIAGLALALCTSSYAEPPSTDAGASMAPSVSQPSAKPVAVSVDLAKAQDPNGFRSDVSRDQRIHVHIDLGRVLEARGSFEAALAEYQQALDACERTGLSRFRSNDQALVERRMAGALDRLGRFTQSEVHYKKAVRLSPRDPKIWNDVGYSYYLQSRWGDAERAFRTGLRYAPEDPRLTTNLGLTLAAAGRTAEALPLLSRYTGDANGHANLGYLLAATGQTDLAREQYLQALALSPNLQLAQRALAQLERAGNVSVVAVDAKDRYPELPSGVKSPSGDQNVQKASQTRSQIPPPRQFVISPAPASAAQTPSQRVR